jgi:hypothetical protein
VKFLDDLAYLIGWTVLEFAALAFVFLVMMVFSKIGDSYPKLEATVAACIRTLGISLWGVTSVGLVVASIVLHVNHRRYGAAIAAAIFGAVLYVPWLVIGWPILKKDLFGHGDKNGL